ncbi:hypothetical protein ACLKA6_017266 [Drosophila palustris]
MDETWIHHFTPESNRQSAEWHAAGESRPKRPKTQQLAGKVMASVFWDAHGIIFIDYLQKGQTINSDYYMALLERLKDKIAKKRPHMAKKKVLFHQDNAPCHKSMKTMAKLNELGFELLPHPPYSPDLAPSDYWLFANLKKMLRGKRFRSNDEQQNQGEEAASAAASVNNNSGDSSTSNEVKLFLRSPEAHNHTHSSSEISTPLYVPQSATEKLIEMFKQQKLEAGKAEADVLESKRA